MNITKENFEELTKKQKMVGDFLKAFDPILDPFENLAKHGISLATGFVGISGTFVAVFVPSTTNNRYYSIILFCSLFMFFGVILLGTIQLWRITKFREQMRKFAFVLLGDKPDECDKKEAMKLMQQSYKIYVKLEYIFLFSGLILFAVWAIIKQLSN